MWLSHLTLLGGVLILSLSKPRPVAFAAVVGPRCANHTDPPYPYYLPDSTGLSPGSGVIHPTPTGAVGLTSGSGSIVGPTGASSSSFSPNAPTLTGGTVSRFGSSSRDTLLPTPLPSLTGTTSTSSNGTRIPSSFSRIRGSGSTISGNGPSTVLPSIRGTSPLLGGTGLPITYPYIFNLTAPSFHGSELGPSRTGSGRLSILTGSSGTGIGSLPISIPTGSRSGTGNIELTASITTVSRNGTGFIVTGTGTGTGTGVSTLSTVTGSRIGSGFIPSSTGGRIVSILTGTTVSRGQITSVATRTISGTSFSPLRTGEIRSTSSSAQFRNASSTDSSGSGSVTGTAASSGEVSVTSVEPFTLTGTATFIIASANISVTLQTRIITSGTRTFTTTTSDPSLLPARTSNTTNPTGQSNSIVRNTSPSGGLPTPVSPLYPFTATWVAGNAGTGLPRGTGLSSIAASSRSSASGSLTSIFPSLSGETGLSLSTDGPITTGITGGPPKIRPPGSLTSGGSLITGSGSFPSVSGLPPGSITSGGLFTNSSILTTSRYVLIPGTFTSGGLTTTDPASTPTQPLTVLPPNSFSTDGPLTTDSVTFPVESPTSLSTGGSLVTDSASVPIESGLLSSNVSNNGPITTSTSTLPIDTIVSLGTFSANGSLSTNSYSPPVVSPTVSTGSFITSFASLPIVSTLPPSSSGGSLITPFETIIPFLSISTKGPLTTDSVTFPIVDPPASFSTLVTSSINGTVATRTVPVIGSWSSAEVASTFGISSTTNSFTGTVTPTTLRPPPIVPTSFETSTKSTSANGPNPPVPTKYSYDHRRPHKGRPGPGWSDYYDPDFEFEDDFTYSY